MGVGAYTMLHITAVILLISMGLYWLVEKRARLIATTRTTSWFDRQTERP